MPRFQLTLQNTSGHSVSKRNERSHYDIARCKGSQTDEVVSGSRRFSAPSNNVNSSNGDRSIRHWYGTMGSCWWRDGIGIGGGWGNTRDFLREKVIRWSGWQHA